MDNSYNYKYVKHVNKVKAGDIVITKHKTNKPVMAVDTGCSCKGITFAGGDSEGFTIKYKAETPPIHLTEDWVRQRDYKVTYLDNTTDTFGFIVTIENKK